MSNTNTLFQLFRLVPSLFGVALIILFTSVTFSQSMYAHQTVYTDADFDGTNIHTWGYTYAPSGNAVLHNYRVRTHIILPGGSSSENFGTGSGYFGARTDVYITIPMSDIINDQVGNINIFSEHDALCPQVYSGTIPFLSTQTIPWTLPLYFATCTTRNTGEEISPPDDRLCFNQPACWNTSSPKCCAGGSLTYEYISRPCCPYYKVGYLSAPHLPYCTPGLSICWGGPGYCSPA